MVVGTCAVLLLSLLLRSARGAAIIFDDDCELAARRDAALLDWSLLRRSLVAGDILAARPLWDAALASPQRSERECPLGLASACIARLSASADANGGASACLDGLQLMRILASRWPIFLLLAEMQSRIGGDGLCCDDLPHPSVDWGDFRAKVRAYTVDVPPWLAGLNDDVDGGATPESYNEASGAAQGIVWKSSSAAVYEGRTIAEWTSPCVLGVLAAYAIRAASMVVGNGDVYRIVQRAIEHLEQVVDHADDILHSSWPLFRVLHCMGHMKKTFHDSKFSPDDLLPLEEFPHETLRSRTWQDVAQKLRRAGRHQGVTIFTMLPQHRIHFLMNFFKHAERLNYLEPLAIVPGQDNVTRFCEQMAFAFANSHGHMDPTWNPCLPYVSEFSSRSQYMYIHVALQLGLSVLWFDFHIAWLRSPLAWMSEKLAGQARPPSYQQSYCRRECSAVKDPDVFLADEFYVAHWPRSTLLLLRATSVTRQWIQMLLTWISSYAFAIPWKGLHYLAHPDKPDEVASVSFMPEPGDIPRVVLGSIDVKQEVVGFDGWFGDVKGVVAYEINSFLSDDDRCNLLEWFLEGNAKEVQKVLMTTRKFVSPLRPTHRLYTRFAEDLGAPPDECAWQQMRDTYVEGFAAGVEEVFDNLDLARCECLALGAQCLGVTCETEGDLEGAGAWKCTVRQGPNLVASPYGEVSSVKSCGESAVEGCDAPAVLRVVHVNFADGCCEAEQRQSSETSLRFGADESRPLRGDFLDDDFRRRNERLLTFNRTPELTQHKTPTGKIGYYVWKPYVVLRTLQDPALPWDTTVVAWTDAGIHFVGDMTPLIRKYMSMTDVAATRTPMLEGDFSKRDAFLLLDMDYLSVMETSQVATGFILVRKTRLAMEFLTAWLRACEEPRIMTEEPSVLGKPDYPTYLNNNDDQTAFSLLFKKYGFVAFSVGERDEVVYTGRNLAKFVKASDDFALGVNSDREAYLQAADSAAATHSDPNLASVAASR